MKKAPLLQVRSFSLTIDQKRILKNISFSVEAGEYVSIIGPNGAGKTSLLKSLNRIYSGNTGEILLDSLPLEKFSRKDLARIISYVPQTIDSVFAFTVEEFVMMGRYPYLSPFSSLRKQDREIVNEAMVRTQTELLADRGLHTLSGGERQRVYIAATLAQEARIVLLDEPTTFLDPKHQQEISALLKWMNSEKGCTVICVLHDINMAALHSDRIIALKAGEILYNGIAEKIMDPIILSRIFDREFEFTHHPANQRLVILPDIGKPE